MLVSCKKTETEVSEPMKTLPIVVTQPPLKPGQKLDPYSDYAKYWTGLPEWIDFYGITLKIPQQYTMFWTHHNYPIKFINSLERPAKARPVDSLAFSIFLPEFEGYRPEDYLTEFNENEVKIISIEPAPISIAEPDAAGSYPPNVIKRLLDGMVDPNKFEDKYGLRCYESNGNKDPEAPIDFMYCYGLSDATLGEFILLKVPMPPFKDWVKFPIIQVHYFTKRYGGLDVIWRTHVKNFSRWQEIEQHIWKSIEKWNVDKKQITDIALKHINE